MSKAAQDKIWEEAHPGPLRRGAYKFFVRITGGSRSANASSLATIIEIWNNVNVQKEFVESVDDINHATQLCRIWTGAYKGSAVMVMVCHMNLARLFNNEK